MRRAVYLLMVSLLCSCGGGSSSPEPSPESSAAFVSKESLGKALFFDKNLSENRTQSCATCHNPERGFIDDRLNANGQISAVSLGDDGISLGDRNTPTAAYAQFSPEFTTETHNRFNSQQPDYSGHVGGQFLDGRGVDLQAQAEGPPLNPIEMGMSDKDAVVQRILENEDYVAAFKSFYGETIFDDSDEAYAMMAQSIALFEQTDQFFPFDSKYDQSLRGEYVYNPLTKAAAGKALFFSQQFTNCATCHQLHVNGHQEEMFTSYEYHNIGVPENLEARAINGVGVGFVDEGLLSNGEITDQSEKGKFKTPTLRNVAITEPYMHNGVFRDLKTVIQFYDHYLTDSVYATNPETANPWRDAEVTDNIALVELEDGKKLNDANVEALVCFLRTLTDARYEHLIEDKGIDCD